MALPESRTADGLREAFRREAELNRLLMYFAAKADVEGENEAAATLRALAESGTSHASGHLEYLEQIGDPLTGMPIGRTEDNLRSVISVEETGSREFYPELAATAREEGFGEIAEWFETLARAEQAHARRLLKLLKVLEK